MGGLQLSSNMEPAVPTPPQDNKLERKGVLKQIPVSSNSFGTYLHRRIQSCLLSNELCVLWPSVMSLHDVLECL